MEKKKKIKVKRIAKDDSRVKLFKSFTFFIVIFSAIIALSLFKGRILINDMTEKQSKTFEEEVNKKDDFKKVMEMNKKDISLEEAVIIDEIQDVRGLGYPPQRKIVQNSSGEYFLSYRKKVEGKYQIFVAKIYEESGEWKVLNADKPIGYVGGNLDQRVPSIEIDNNDVLYLVWYGSNVSGQKDRREIKFSKSENGENWSNWMNISQVPGYQAQNEYWQEHPYIYADESGNLCAVWEGKDAFNDNQQIKFSRSFNQGKNWTIWKNVKTTMGNTQSRPVILKDGKGRLHLFFYSSFAAGEQQIQYTFSDNEGIDWSDFEIISNQHFDSRHFSAYIDKNDNIHIVWRAVSNPASHNSQIMYRKLAGESGQKKDWSEIKEVYRTDNYQFFPSVSTIDQEGVIITWMETVQSSEFPRENPLQSKAYIAYFNPDIHSDFDQREINPSIQLERESYSFYPTLSLRDNENNRIPIVYLEKQNDDTYIVKLKFLKY